MAPQPGSRTSTSMGLPTLLETKEVTIIDFSKIENATENGTLPLEGCKEVLKIADDLKEAFSHRRVVYLINHGISEEEAQNMYSLFDRFLALPDYVKDEYRSQGSKDYNGYLPRNSEQFYEQDKEELHESFNVVGNDRDFPNDEIPEFSQAVKNLSKKYLRISNFLLQLFAISLDVSTDIFLDSHKDMWNHLHNMSILRILFYPPVDEEPHPGIIRCGEHTDYGTFTLLMQDSEGGLEVSGENGEWRRVGHIPGAIFLNTGDMLEIWSSGRYKGTLHRVVVPEVEQVRNRSRYSIGFFVQPDVTAVVKPLDPTPDCDVKECIAGVFIGSRMDRADVTVTN